VGPVSAAGFVAPVVGVATGAVRKESPARGADDEMDCGIPPPTGLAECDVPPKIAPCELPPENEPAPGDEETGFETCVDAPELE